MAAHQITQMHVVEQKGTKTLKEIQHKEAEFLGKRRDPSLCTQYVLTTQVKLRAAECESM